MDDDRARPWNCPQGHKLGLVTRDGGGVRRLLLYRHAIDYSTTFPEDMDVIATVEGYVADVRCSICGSVRTWVPGEEELKRLLERVSDV